MIRVETRRIYKVKMIAEHRSAASIIFSETLAILSKRTFLNVCLSILFLTYSLQNLSM